MQSESPQAESESPQAAAVCHTQALMFVKIQFLEQDEKAYKEREGVGWVQS